MLTSVCFHLSVTSEGAPPGVESVTFFQRNRVFSIGKACINTTPRYLCWCLSSFWPDPVCGSDFVRVCLRRSMASSGCWKSRDSFVEIACAPSGMHKKHHPEVVLVLFDHFQPSPVRRCDFGCVCLRRSVTSSGC